MKVLIVNFEYPPLGGGGGVATRQIAEELGRRHTIHVLTTAYQGLVKEDVKNGVHIHRVAVLGRGSLPTASLISLLTFVPAAIIKGIGLCRKEKFNVINAQFVVPSGMAAAVLARIFNVPFVLSFIGGDVYDPTKGISPHRYGILRWIVRLIAKGATAMTAISEDTKRRATEMHGVTGQITVTHLGLIPTKVADATREELDLPAHVPLFVTVGRLIPRKGYQTLLKAWQDLNTAHLVIVGSGPMQKDLEQLIKKYDLTGRVHLTGFVDENKKKQILRTATAYISSAEHEGFGIVFLEAMEAGLPIIAADRGGHRDFLLEGENAILIPVSDVRQLKATVVWLLKDGRLRDRMAMNNKEKVTEFYLEKTAGRFEQILKKAAK